MKYFLDLEFIECGSAHPIELISLGIVAEDGREFYAVSTEFNPFHADDWVVANVLDALPPILETKADHYHHEHPVIFVQGDPLSTAYEAWKTRERIKEDILAFVGDDPNPEFWGEWCSYDWVVFCQLFGTMMDLPEGWPMRCRDVVQYCEDKLGLSTDDWPESLETPGNHNALLGVKTVKARWEWCKENDVILNEQEL